MVLHVNLPQLDDCSLGRSQQRFGKMGMCDPSTGDVLKDAVCHQNLSNTSWLGVSNNFQCCGEGRLTIDSRRVMKSY